MLTAQPFACRRSCSKAVSTEILANAGLMWLEKMQARLEHNMQASLPISVLFNSRSRLIFAKVMVGYTVRNFTPFIEPVSRLPYSQGPASYPYLQPQDTVYTLPYYFSISILLALSFHLFQCPVRSLQHFRQSFRVFRFYFILATCATCPII
jgi:hypothetical protein